MKLLQKRTREFHCPILYVNMVGGQDELVFDGRSMAVNQKGQTVMLASSFEEDIKTIDIYLKNNRAEIIGKPVKNEM